MIRLLAVPVILLLSAAPAVAAVPFCQDMRSGLTVTWSFGNGPQRNQQATQLDLDKIALRRLGVDVRRLELWNGCLRAFVRKPGGGEEMQFFDPNDYARIYVD